MRMSKRLHMLKSSLITCLQRPYQLSSFAISMETSNGPRGQSNNQQNQAPRQVDEEENEEQDDGVDYDNSGADPVNKWLPRNKTRSSPLLQDKNNQIKK